MRPEEMTAQTKQILSNIVSQISIPNGKLFYVLYLSKEKNMEKFIQNFQVIYLRKVHWAVGHLKISINYDRMAFDKSSAMCFKFV